jgi:RNA polymerase sigma factor (sigma-70 family)
MDKDIIIDEKFINKLKKGHERSYHQLYEYISPSMKMVCRRYVKSESESEDVFQDGFLKIYKNIEKLKSHESFMGWAKRIFINTSIDYLNLNKKGKVDYVDEFRDSQFFAEIDEHSDNAINSDFEGDISDIDYSIIRKVDFSQEEMLEVLELIPEHFRIVFQLYSIDDFKHQEIAKLLAISESTSKTRLLRARGLLKQELRKLAFQKLNDGRTG